MKKKRHTKLIHEGQYVAEVDVELIETDEGWSPYLSVEDAYNWMMSVPHYAAAI
jgi:hypothetical protein